jgi:cytochrome bd-type quinol oxidase subunit 2
MSWAQRMNEKKWVQYTAGALYVLVGYMIAVVIAVWLMGPQRDGGVSAWALVWAVPILAVMAVAIATWLKWSRQNQRRSGRLS